MTNQSFRYSVLDWATLLFLGYLLSEALQQTWLSFSILAAAKSVEIGLTFVLVAIRKPIVSLNARPFALLLAVLHIFAPYYFTISAPIAPQELSQALLLIGSGLVIASLLNLKRSFGILPAFRGLRTAGPYQLVRHPVYLGHMIIFSGVLLENFSRDNLLAFLAVVTVMHLRIVLEEKELGRATPEYATYQAQIPYRLLPFIY